MSQIQSWIQKYRNWKRDFDKRNEEYYIEAFRKLDQGIDSWNWAGFFLGNAFLAYRKAYGSALLIICTEFLLVYVSVLIFLIFCDVDGAGRKAVILSLFIDLFFRCFVGYFGNRIFYRSLKKKIRAGYHVTDSFYPIASLFIFAGVFCNLYSDITLLIFILIPIFWLADYTFKHIYFRTHTPSEEDTSINEKSIRSCLGFNKIEGSKHKIISYSMMITFVLVIVTNYENPITKYADAADFLQQSKSNFSDTIKNQVNQEILEDLMEGKDRVIDFDLFLDKPNEK